MILGPGVHVSADVAAELARFADAGRRSMLTVNGVRMSAELEQTLAELRAVARASADVDATRLRVDATTVRREAERMIPTMTATEFAARIGKSRQAVVARCNRGTLPATKVDGRWMIFENEEYSTCQ